VLWYLQSPGAIPEELVEDDHPLASYVLPEKEPTGPSYWPDRAWYDFNCHTIRQWKSVESPGGRYQVELLIRACNQAIDSLLDDWGKAMDEITLCCEYLRRYHGVFRSVSADEAQCKSDHVTNL